MLHSCTTVIQVDEIVCSCLLANTSSNDLNTSSNGKARILKGHLVALELPSASDEVQLVFVADGEDGELALCIAVIWISCLGSNHLLEGDALGKELYCTSVAIGVDKAEAIFTGEE